MKYAATALLGAAVYGAAAFVAFAQTNDPEAGDRIQEELAERALTRPLQKAPPLGQPAGEIVEDKINWTEMRTELALTQRREIAARQSTTAALPRPSGMRAAAAETFKNVALREVNVTRLPVLAPEGARVAQTLKVYSLGDSYSATAEVENGVSMRMSGTRKKIVIGDVKSARARLSAMRDNRKTLGSVSAPYFVARSESSTDLTFAKFGAGYVLSIMCDDPADARCAEDGFITNLASNLILMNPEAGGE